MSVKLIVGVLLVRNVCRGPQVIEIQIQQIIDPSKLLKNSSHHLNSPSFIQKKVTEPLKCIYSQFKFKNNFPPFSVALFVLHILFCHY